MSLRVPSIVFAAAALSAAMVPAPVEDPGAESVFSAEHPQVVFQLRSSAAGADVGRLMSERLARGSAWRPGRLRELFAGRARAAAPQAIPARGLERVFVSDLPPGVSAEHAAERLANDPRVEYAQVDHLRETHSPPGDPFFHTSGSWGQPYADLWGLHRIGAGSAMELSRGLGMIVAVVDSGVDYDHPDLQSQRWLNPEEQLVGLPDNGFPDDFFGWDFVSSDNEPKDEFGHGTHMAGIVAAAENNGGTVGAAPRAAIMSVRAVNGAGASNSSTLAQGVVYAADNGAHVILISSGCIARCPSDPVLESAIRHAFAKRALVVVSAGNRNDDLSFYSPQNMTNPKPVVVGGTNQLDQRASNSNTGDLLDLVAPGGGTSAPPPSFQPTLNILSVGSTPCSPLVCNPALLVSNGTETRYLRRAGTSMSAAFVAGVAAQIVSEDPRKEIDDVRAHLLGNAVDRGPRGRDVAFGWGRLDAVASVGDLRRYAIAHIAVPASGQVVSGVVRIAGTAAARELERFEVSVGQGPSPATWQTAGVTPVLRPSAFGELARWDTTGLPGGTWTIRLAIEDQVLGVREHRRTVTVAPTVSQPMLVVEVDGQRGGSGSVHVGPVAEFCDGLPYSAKTCSYPLPPGTVTLTPHPDALSSFVGWSGACAGSGACSVPVSAVRFVRATFRGPYRLGLEIERGRHGQGGTQTVPPDAACGAGEICRYTYAPGTSVTVFAFEGGPLDSWAWLEGPCHGTSSQLVMDEDHLCKAISYQVDINNPLTMSAGLDQRAPLGTPVLLTGYAFSQAQPVTVTWIDDTTGEFLGDQPELSVTLGYGVHDLRFTATDASGFSDSDRMLVVVHEP